MDVLFFVFFQAIVRAVARDPTDTEALKPVLGLLKSDDLAPLGALGKPKTGCWGMGKGTATCSECCWFLCVCSFASLFFDLFRIAAFSLVLRSQRDHESNGFMFWDRLHQQVGKRTYWEDVDKTRWKHCDKMSSGQTVSCFPGSQQIRGIWCSIPWDFHKRCDFWFTKVSEYQNVWIFSIKSQDVTTCTAMPAIPFTCIRRPLQAGVEECRRAAGSGCGTCPFKKWIEMGSLSHLFFVKQFPVLVSIFETHWGGISYNHLRPPLQVRHLNGIRSTTCDMEFQTMCLEVVRGDQDGHVSNGMRRGVSHHQTYYCIASHLLQG